MCPLDIDFIHLDNVYFLFQNQSNHFLSKKALSILHLWILEVCLQGLIALKIDWWKAMYISGFPPKLCVSQQYKPNFHLSTSRISQMPAMH